MTLLLHMTRQLFLLGISSALLALGGMVSAQELSPYQIYAQTAPAVVFIAGYGPGMKGMGGTG
jgi:hypothetical protein